MRAPTIILPLLLLGIVALQSRSGAAIVEELYEVAVPVEDRSVESRRQGLREALARVLVRVTGRRAAAGDPDLVPLLDNAARYVLQYGYTVEDELRVVFDAASLERALAEQGQPIWGRERPLTLLWLAIDPGDGQRMVLGAATEEETPSGEMLDDTREFLHELATERGVPLVLPLLDAEDYAALEFADLCGGFEDKIRAASQRYRPDAVLVGCARPGAGDRYRVRWMLQQASGPQHWTGGLEDGLQVTADSFARDFATAGAQASLELEIVVDGIDDFDDYGRVLGFLERLTVIRQIAIQRVEGHSITFDVLSRTDADRLGRAITLMGDLEPAPRPFDEPDRFSRQALYFRLRP